MQTRARRMAYRIALLALTVMPTAFVAANEPLAIRVSPAVSFAPANLVILTSITPDPANRTVEITADPVEFYRSSTIQLEGDRAPKTTRFEFRNLPAGEYEVRASVFGADGRPKAIARAEVHVVELGSTY